jgi:hypothetical protein
MTVITKNLLEIAEPRCQPLAAIDMFYEENSMIVRAVLGGLTARLDDFVGSLTDKSGKPIPPSLARPFDGWAWTYGYFGQHYVILESDVRVDWLLARLPWDTSSLAEPYAMVWLRLRLTRFNGSQTIREQELTGYAVLVHWLLSSGKSADFPAGGCRLLHQVLHELATSRKTMSLTSSDWSVTAQRASEAGAPFRFGRGALAIEEEMPTSRSRLSPRCRGMA